MCRMFFQCALEPFNIEYELLKKFVSSCRWQYLRKYNLFGHHGLGWGFAYIPEDEKNLVIKHDITPIYQADWKNLKNLKTRFLLVHARKTMPWKRNFNDVHPININENYVIVHNGIIKNFSFPQLETEKLETIKSETKLDTRKYLCSIIDKLNTGLNLKEALESLFNSIQIGAAANAFLFNSRECNIINYHNTNFNGRHHTLFITKNQHKLFVSTTPIKNDMLELPNRVLIRVNLRDLDLKFEKLSF